MTAGVMINKMQLRGSIEHKQVLLDALDHQHWGEDDQRIIFINQLSVSGYWWELAQKIARETRDFSNQIASAGEQHFPDQLAIFSNYSEFIGHSIQCLLAGKNPWYLKTWLKQEDLVADQVSILQHKIFELPAIFESLRKANQLTKLILTLNVSQLQGLVFSLGSVNPVLLSPTLDFQSPRKSSLLIESASKWIADLLSEISSAADSESKTKLIIQLVSGLSVWRFAPQLMSDDQLYREWFSAVVQIAREKAYPTLTLPLAGEGTGRAHLQVNFDDSSLIIDEANEKPLLRIGSDIPSPLPRGRLGEGEDLPQFFIQQTGLLFLINFLKAFNLALTPALSVIVPDITLPSASTQSSQRERGQFLPLSEGEVRRGCEDRASFITNPWVLLYQAFQTICNKLNCSMEKSLRDLIICISQLSDEDFYQQLEGCDHSENKLAEVLEQKLQSMNLWRADWMYLSARAEVNQAYINIYLDNSSVNLQLRLSGLDVNPGWVPWLGRVIYFHYGNYPALKLAASEGT